MKRHFLAAAMACGLMGCDGNPFVIVVPEEPADPGTGANAEVFTLEVNQLRYDPDTDTLIINNLPFDGPDGVYTRVAGFNLIDGYALYESTQTTETGQRKYFALYKESDGGNGEVGVVATGDYNGFGFGGTAERRLKGSGQTPPSGEYVYTGDYGGFRVGSNPQTANDALQIVEGDARLEIDIDDFDLTGAVEGFVTNRESYNVNGTPVQPLPPLIFRTASIEDGTITGGTAAAFNNDGTVREEGTYQGLFVGANGEEVVGSVNVAGGMVNEVFVETFIDGNGDEQERTLTYVQFQQLQAAAAGGNANAQQRLANTEQREVSVAGAEVRETGVFTVRD